MGERWQDRELRLMKRLAEQDARIKDLEGPARRLVVFHDLSLSLAEKQACRCLQCKNGLRALRRALAGEGDKSG